MPTAATTHRSELRRAVREFMAANRGTDADTLRGMILGLTSSTIEEVLEERRRAMREAPARRSGTVETIRPATPEEVAAMRERQGKPAEPVKVRVEQNYGGCRVLGEHVRTTETGYTYRDSNGRTRRVAFTRRPRYAGERAPRPHLEPCGDCPERRDPNACIHGRVGFCETCMST